MVSPYREDPAGGERCARRSLFPFLQKVFLDSILTREEVILLHTGEPSLPFSRTKFESGIPVQGGMLTSLVLCPPAEGIWAHPDVAGDRMRRALTTISQQCWALTYSSILCHAATGALL